MDRHVLIACGDTSVMVTVMSGYRQVLPRLLSDGVAFQTKWTRLCGLWWMHSVVRKMLSFRLAASVVGSLIVDFLTNSYDGTV